MPGVIGFFSPAEEEITTVTAPPFAMARGVVIVTVRVGTSIDGARTRALLVALLVTLLVTLILLAEMLAGIVVPSGNSKIICPPRPPGPR